MNKDCLMEVPKMVELDGLTMDAVSDVLSSKAPTYGINCVNWKKQFPYHPLTEISVAHSDNYIYVNFFVRCNYLRAVNYRNNTNVCEDSCVEFLLKVPGSEEYWNFEFNCIGTVNASHRKDRKNPTRLTDAEIDRIKRYASCGTSPFNEMEGLFPWTLTIAIPFDLIGLDPKTLPVTIEGNFYKCASGTSMPHYLSWAPIKTEAPNFHCPEFFGQILLCD